MNFSHQCSSPLPSSVRVSVKLIKILIFFLGGGESKRKSRDPVLSGAHTILSFLPPIDVIQQAITPPLFSSLPQGLVDYKVLPPIEEGREHEISIPLYTQASLMFLSYSIPLPLPSVSFSNISVLFRLLLHNSVYGFCLFRKLKRFFLIKL